MKKYMYSLLFLFVLITIVGFTSNHIQNRYCQKAEMFVDFGHRPIDKEILQGKGVYQPLTTDSLYTDMRVANYQLGESSYLNWQSLPSGRMIIVVEGEGYFQSKGKEVILIRKGDRIEILPGLYHWIGATLHSKLEFISMTSQKSEELIHWHEAVSVEEYQQASSVKY